MIFNLIIFLQVVFMLYFFFEKNSVGGIIRELVHAKRAYIKVWREM